jgi:hypothetical protein
MFTWNVWTPRLGFNLKLTDDGRTVLRGHYGRAYRTIFLGDFEDVHPGLSPITLARWNPATRSYSTIISVTNSTSNIAVDPSLDSPFTDSYSLGLDRELRANLGVSVTYAHKRGRDQVGWTDVGGVYGTRTDILPDGRSLTVMPLLNAASARRFVRTNGPGAFMRYSGLLLALHKRMSQRWQAAVSYTYSKSEGLTTTGQDPNDNINAAGRLSLDRPQMVVATGTYEVPVIDMAVSASLMSVTGAPYAPQALIQLPQGRRAINIEPPGSYRLPSQRLLDIRVTKIMFRRGDRRLELSAELANALQETAHASVVSQNFFSATFGAPATFIDPRRLNLVARVQF